MSSKSFNKVAAAVSTAILGMTFSSHIYAAQPANSDNVGHQNKAQMIDFNQLKNSLPKRYIIKYHDDISLQQMDTASRNAVNSVAQLNGVKIKKEHRNINALSAELTDDAYATLSANPNIAYIEEDKLRRFMAETIPYGISLVQADQVDDSVAAASAGGKKVCVIDSGLGLPHEDMGNQGENINGTNVSGTGNWYVAGGSHGTHVAGTVGALSNGVGVRGVIGSDVDMHIVKVFNDDGWGYAGEVADAIDVCINNGADVINMSLGGDGATATERNRLQGAYDAGVLLIAAAGNDGVITETTDKYSYPASYDSVMSVGGVDSSKSIYTSTQKNSQVEIAAPGVDVYSTFPTGDGRVPQMSIAGVDYESNTLENAGNSTGLLYDFSTGESTDSGASGNICLIQRGNISFHDKVLNCENSGGLGAIIYNNESGTLSATLGETNATTIPAVAISQSLGNTLLTQTGQMSTVNVLESNYSAISGTSMASPHVAGVATLIWSHYPSCTNAQIRNVLNASAEDLGVPGRDVNFGHGLVQAKAALDYLATNGCEGGPVTGTVQLTNGVAQSGLAADKEQEIKFTLDVPAGASDLSFVMSGGTGDADLYVKFGGEPSASDYDCRSWANGNNESCLVSSAQAGTYHVKVIAYKAFSGASLVGTYTEGTSGSGPTSFENTENYSIPDNNSTGISSPISSSREGASNTVSVDVNIVHTYIGDLIVDLIHPDGTVFNLHNQSGRSADNINQNYSVDVGNRDSAGTWNLRVRDLAGQDTGYIDSWKISFQ